MASTVKEKITTGTAVVKNKVNLYTEKIAVMIVTTCVIPICVLLLGIWIIKTILGLSIPVKLPQASKILKKNEDDDE
ncbi:MAG: hypothetical protein KBS63_06785 [Clostridiales bacterium]|nr:hypothetical protein [Candidatus Crickella caballi]